MGSMKGFLIVIGAVFVSHVAARSPYPGQGGGYVPLQCPGGLCGVNCDECCNGKSPPDCDCPAGKYGDFCELCRNGKCGDNCKECCDGQSPPGCDCPAGKYGENCEICSNGKCGDNCDECCNGKTGPLCDTCPFGRYGDDCEICSNRKCGVNCDECCNGKIPPDCDNCPAGKYGDDCEICSNGKCGVNCDQGCGPPPCKYRPTNFNDWPYTIPFAAFGSVNLSGDVDKGRMLMNFSGAIDKPSGVQPTNTAQGGQQTRSLLMKLDQFDVSRLWFKKGKTEVDQRVVPTSAGCSDCDFKIKMGDDCAYVPPVTDITCYEPMDIIMALDVSKSISATSGLAGLVTTTAGQIAASFNIGSGDKRTRCGLTTFGDQAMRQWAVNSDTAQSPKGVQSGISHVQYSNGFSNHAAAIDSAALEFRKRGRWGFPKSFIMIADGKPNKNVQRIEGAFKHLRTINGLCVVVLGVNISEGSEAEAFFRDMLGCHSYGACPSLVLGNVIKATGRDTAVQQVVNHICVCSGKCPKQPDGPEKVTTFTVRLEGVVLADFGSRDEVNRAVDGLLAEAASAMGVTRDRLQAIGIEDTNGVSIDNASYNSAYSRELRSSNAGPRQTMVEVMFNDPGQNIEPESQESVRRLAQLLAEPQSSLCQGLASQGLGTAGIERMAVRAYDGNMPIIDIIQT